MKKYLILYSFFFLFLEIKSQDVNWVSVDNLFEQATKNPNRPVYIHPGLFAVTFLSDEILTNTSEDYESLFLGNISQIHKPTEAIPTEQSIAEYIDSVINPMEFFYNFIEAKEKIGNVYKIIFYKKGINVFHVKYLEIETDSQKSVVVRSQIKLQFEITPSFLVLGNGESYIADYSAAVNFIPNFYESDYFTNYRIFKNKKNIVLYQKSLSQNGELIPCYSYNIGKKEFVKLFNHAGVFLESEEFKSGIGKYIIEDSSCTYISPKNEEVLCVRMSNSDFLALLDTQFSISNQLNFIPKVAQKKSRETINVSQYFSELPLLGIENYTQLLNEIILVPSYQDTQKFKQIKCKYRSFLKSVSGLDSGMEIEDKLGLNPDLIDFMQPHLSSDYRELDGVEFNQLDNIVKINFGKDTFIAFLISTTHVFSGGENYYKWSLVLFQKTEQNKLQWVGDFPVGDMNYYSMKLNLIEKGNLANEFLVTEILIGDKELNLEQNKRSAKYSLIIDHRGVQLQNIDSAVVQFEGSVNDMKLFLIELKMEIYFVINSTMTETDENREKRIVSQSFKANKEFNQSAQITHDKQLITLKKINSGWVGFLNGKQFFLNPSNVVSISQFPE